MSTPQYERVNFAAPERLQIILGYLLKCEQINTLEANGVTFDGTFAIRMPSSAISTKRGVAVENTVIPASILRIAFV